MAEQNFKNHSRLSAGYHGVTYLLILAVIGGSIWRLSRLWPADRLGSTLLILAGLALAFLAFFTRSFALKAQDRAIRAEETLRYFMLTGKRPPALKMGQYIALRFASDEEMPALADKAVSQQMSSTQIKQEVRNWRADHKRV